MVDIIKLNKPAVGEVTSPQTVAYVTEFFQQPGVGYLPAVAMPVTYDNYRTIRRDPTIALARVLLAAPVLAGGWAVEADKGVAKKKIKEIEEQFLPLRESVVESALFGGIDFGWAGFEKVYEEKNGKICLKKFKPLLHDLTDILIASKTGAFAGFYQGRDDMTLALAKSFLVPFRVEGTKWQGESLLENVRPVYNKWIDAESGAARYDVKVAGSHIVIWYPPGTSVYNGAETDNAVIAEAVAKALQSAGSAILPRIVSELPDMVGTEKQWDISILEDRSGRQPTFVDRLRYLDILKVRGMLLPERAILEGEFGTKAEAAAHIDLALTNMVLTDRYITRHVNWFAVDDVLAMNYGEDSRGTVRLTCVPLADTSLDFLRKIYMEVLKSPSGFLEEFGTIDTKTLKEKLEIPSKEPEKEEEPKEPMPIQPVPGREPMQPGQEPPQPGTEESQRFGYLTRKMIQVGGDGHK